MAPVAETKLPTETPKQEKEKAENDKKDEAKKEKEDAEMVNFITILPVHP